MGVNTAQAKVIISGPSKSARLLGRATLGCRRPLTRDVELFGEPIETSARACVCVYAFKM